MEGLSVNNERGRSSMFLTADKRLIASAMDVAEQSHLDYRVLKAIIMPVQFSYYLELDEEKGIDWKAYSKILWSRGFIELHRRIDEFYTDRVLREYEPRLLESLGKILSGIQREIDRRKVISEDEFQEENAKVRQFRYLEQFDEQFYSIMNQEKEIRFVIGWIRECNARLKFDSPCPTH